MRSSHAIVLATLVLGISSSALAGSRAAPAKTRAGRATVQLGTYTGAMTSKMDMQRLGLGSATTTTRKTLRVVRRGKVLSTTVTNHDALGAGRDLTSTMSARIVDETTAPNGDKILKVRFSGRRFLRTVADDSDKVQAAQGSAGLMRITSGEATSTLTFRREGGLGYENEGSLGVRIDSLGIAGVATSSAQAEFTPIATR
jgi:hypothetical protein